MPLYWSTDKIIAGKYRLKKPVPVSYEYNYDDTSVDMLNASYIFTGEEDDDGRFISDVEKMLNGDFSKDINGNIIQHEVEFIEKFKEYLEEIN